MLDQLRYCYHAARAIVENRNVRLTNDDPEMLLADNPKAGTFVRDNFKGIFFTKGVHGLIDTIRANIDKANEAVKRLGEIKAIVDSCLQERRSEPETINTSISAPGC